MQCFIFVIHLLYLVDFLLWQERLAGLEAEKKELGQQIDNLLWKNRGLIQVKMSLGLEVAAYRYTVGAVWFLFLHILFRVEWPG